MTLSAGCRKPTNNNHWMLEMLRKSDQKGAAILSVNYPPNLFLLPLNYSFSPCPIFQSPFPLTHIHPFLFSSSLFLSFSNTGSNDPASYETRISLGEERSFHVKLSTVLTVPQEQDMVKSTARKGNTQKKIVLLFFFLELKCQELNYKLQNLHLLFLSFRKDREAKMSW